MIGIIFPAHELRPDSRDADLVPFVLAFSEQTRILTVELVSGTIEEDELKVFLIEVVSHATTVSVDDASGVLIC